MRRSLALMGLVSLLVFGEFLSVANAADDAAPCYILAMTSAQADTQIVACSAAMETLTTAKDLSAAYYNRGNAYSTKGDYDRAIADYDEAIKLDPKDATAYRNRGIAYSNKGDTDRATVDYNEAIKLNPNDATAYFGRGIISTANGNKDRATADFNEVSRFTPKSLECQGNVTTLCKEGSTLKLWLQPRVPPLP